MFSMGLKKNSVQDVRDILRNIAGTDLDMKDVLKRASRT